MIEGHFTTRGQIEYCFKAFGAVVILCIETKMKMGDDQERLNVIAQVIAECLGQLALSHLILLSSEPSLLAVCNFNNAQENFHIPIYGILCDGVAFEFFSFDGSTKPFTFLRGCFPEDPRPLRRGLQLSDFELTETTIPFIRNVRVVCETISGIMLLAYISSLAACHDLPAAKSTKERKPRKDSDKWDAALQSATQSLQKSCHAYVRHREMGAHKYNG